MNEGTAVLQVLFFGNEGWWAVQRSREGVSRTFIFPDFRLTVERKPRYISVSYDMRGLNYLSRRLLIATLLSSSGLLSAQGDLASREVAKRAAASQRAHALLEKGDASYEANDYNSAVTVYRSALSELPKGGDEIAELRAATIQRFSQAAVERARAFTKMGDYAAANDLLDEVEAVNDSLDAAAAQEMRKKIEDPIRTNPALTKEHSANVDQVRQLLYEAHGFLDLGQFDRAQMTYEDVLRIDPYNKAARRGTERVLWYKTDYATAAYDETRAAMLKDVAAQWESQSYRTIPDVPVIDETIDGRMIAVSAPLVKLRSIQIPFLDLSDVSLEEALDYLRSVSVENDNTALGDSPKGLSFLTQLGSEDHPLVKEIRSARINLQLQNIPLEQALKFICEATKTTYRVDEFAVVIRPAGATDNTLVRREFRVSPDFLSRSALGGEAAGNDDPFADPDEGGGSLLARRFTAKEKLKSMGITFPEGSNAYFNSSSSTLVVRNTVENLDLVRQYVDLIAQEEPVAVIVRTTILEVQQTNQAEMAYDMILNTIQAGGSLYAGGGTVGNGSSLSDMLNGTPVTSGNRSGTEVLTDNSLDSVLTRQPFTSSSTRFTYAPSVSGLAGASSSQLIVPPTGAAAENRAPGALSLQAVIDNNLHQMILRGVDQKKGVDLKTQPEVITRSGENAVIKSVREILFPDEYEPPELPNSVGGGGLIDLNTGQVEDSNTTVPITPATPTSFLPDEIGITLEVMPTISSDRRYVDVSIHPQIRELLGFVNFGTPITGAGGTVVSNLAANGNSQQLQTSSSQTNNVVTENAILKPLIRNIEQKSTVTIADGHTIVIGGLMSENIETFNDGTPILKDLPYFGRFFKSHGMRTIKKNLLIMVQVEIVDPSGKPIRNR